MVLLGSPSPHTALNALKDPDSIIFTEIVEFALSLVPVAKGQDPFGGLPHLQAYRLIRAVSLVEVGDVAGANRLVHKQCPSLCLTFLSGIARP